MGWLGFSACQGCPSCLSLSLVWQGGCLLTTSLLCSYWGISSYGPGEAVNYKTQPFPALSSFSPAPCPSPMLSITCLSS